MTRRKFISALKQVFHSSQEAVIQYLTQEIKFLLSHLARRPKPTQGDKTALARAAKAVNPLYLEKTFNLFTPATLDRWYRELVQKKWDYSHLKKKSGRPRISPDLEALILKLALENPQDGYDSLLGRLQTLGFQANAETIQNVLNRNGIPPGRNRQGQLTWKQFLETNWDSMVATDFLTWEVFTPFGLITYYILFFIRLKDRQVHIAGVTPHPNGDWMRQTARNLTDPEDGFLKPGMVLLHDRDTKYTANFTRILNESGVETRKLPPESPNLNAYAERFVRTVKEQCLSRLIITSETQLRKTLREFLAFYHHERCHQGIGNVIPFPLPEHHVNTLEGRITKKSRLGNLLNFYFRLPNPEKTLSNQEKIAV